MSTAEETLQADEVFLMIEDRHDEMGLSKKERRRWWRKAIRVNGYDILRAQHNMIVQALGGINTDLFITRGRGGDSEPHDLNDAAMLHALVRMFKPLARNGQCSSDVYKNTAKMNRYTIPLKPPFRSGLDTVEKYVMAINEQILSQTNFRIVYLGRDEK